MNIFDIKITQTSGERIWKIVAANSVAAGITAFRLAIKLDPTTPRRIVCLSSERMAA